MSSILQIGSNTLELLSGAAPISAAIATIAAIAAALATNAIKTAGEKLLSKQEIKISEVLLKVSDEKLDRGLDSTATNERLTIDQMVALAVERKTELIAAQIRLKSDLVSGLVNAYHTQALGQAKVQFWFSIAAATVGFLYILGSALTATGPSEGLLKIIPGVVIDAAALLFFRQAEQTRERATALYDRLREDQQIEKANQLVETIDDLHVRSLVQAQIALHRSGLKPKDLDLQLPG